MNRLLARRGFMRRKVLRSAVAEAYGADRALSFTALIELARVANHARYITVAEFEGDDGEGVGCPLTQAGLANTFDQRERYLDFAQAFDEAVAARGIAPGTYRVIGR